MPSQKKKKKRDQKSSTKMQKNSDGRFSPPRRPHFFKIILQDMLNQSKISLPIRYVREHGNDLLGSETVLLKLPDGREWQLGLKKSNGTIWLQDGWKEFAQHYQLKRGSFLVFRHDGSCRFEVIMFDLSATEIDYPSPCYAGEGSNTREGYHEQAEEVGDEEKEDDGDIDDDDDVSVEIIGESFRSPDVQKWMKDNADHGHRVIKRQKKETKVERVKALAIAKSFKSTNPFFKVVMRPSYICVSGSHMPIPADFTKKHISTMDAHVILHHTDRRSWEVLCHCSMRKESASPRASFRHGWNEFVKDNHLKVGDVCVFELSNPLKLEFEVTIYRV